MFTCDFKDIKHECVGTGGKQCKKKKNTYRTMYLVCKINSNINGSKPSSCPPTRIL